MTPQPANYNAAADLLERNLTGERAGKVAIVDETGSHTYAALAGRVARFASLLRELGVQPEQRIVLCLLDGIDFHTCFLGAIRAGVVPIPANTLCPPTDYAWILADSRAMAAIVSAARLADFVEAARMADWHGHVIVAGQGGADFPILANLLETMHPVGVAATRPDDVCFWLYTSGSTGKPKGAMHVHTSLMRTAELFGQGVLGITANDVVYSAAKLFFAYGLGNSLTFPMATGASSILFSGRVTPDAVITILRDKKPTVFFGVPTLFNLLINSPDLPASGQHNLRCCVSAGEALPEHVGRAWRERTGVDIVDGIGSTEMLHIFVSNRPGAVRYGSTGRPVPGYRVRLSGEDGGEVQPGEIGEMQVSGPTAATGYWNNQERTRRTFAGEWVSTGDKFLQAPEGDFVHCGRADDMLKVSGRWVSPIEVESVLITHEAVFEAGVIGALDEDGLIRPKAFVVLKPGLAQDPQLAHAVRDFAAGQLPSFKCPHWIEFVDSLPKTATGKLRRYLLRQAQLENCAKIGTS